MNTREVAIKYFDIVDGPDIATAQSLNVLPEVSIDQGKMTIQDLYKAANRDARGNLHLVYGKKTVHKVEITWGLLTRNEWGKLLAFIKSKVDIGQCSFYCKVFMPDFADEKTGEGEIRIIEMYAGDRSAVPYLVNPTTGMPTYWKNCQCNFIEI